MAVVNSVSCPPSEWPIMPRREASTSSLKVVQRTPRIPNILALHALAFRDAVHRLVILVVTTFELARGVLPLVEAERVEDHGNVAAASQLERVVLVGTRGKSCRAIFPDLVLPTVLMVTQDCREAA